ncbi:3-deoxy-manno-octulosonate cytidylyltransferase [Maritimibacter sp. DP07]|uniref:3-deoxy-manno-octulosonate cytidylyltransferase n=1 Tax=Maritimibacter harenae TaxID=2606218 RepID=A0A845LZ87_9RHOB|nr:manno-octulosonate cytidylyltransferase [Maritimibacter harenae]MZR12646.1 3-deoxy-manno-octulosonate cytidylyltransferase [Maritimibacter harenae]
MKTAILIPARYASTRYPGKPLVPVRQPDGATKSLIEMSWEAARAVPGIDDVFVVTDDPRIEDAAHRFGADVIMTARECENGTARCADAVARAGLDADLVVNLQGDAPLTPPWFVEALIDEMIRDPEARMATPIIHCDRETYGNFVEDRRRGMVGGTTAVCDRFGNALYFSKEVLPWLDPQKVAEMDVIPVFHHVGVYAYRRETLLDYAGWGECELERHEGLEQLRFLANGEKVRCVEVEARGRVFWELNNPHDTARIEQALEAMAQ